jgi:hypothetical protein
MPYIIRPRKFPSGVVAACTALLVFGAASAQAATSPAKETSQCKEPTLTQPFLYAGDLNYYVLAPGQTPDNFLPEGSGWTLSGGASIKATTVADGKAGYVLDLPSGSKAVSPIFCVTSEYPTARTFVRDLSGSQGVYLNVSYEGTATWNKPKNTGQVHGNNTEWTLSTPVNLQPENVTGWQILRLTLVPGGTKSDFQLSNLYIDPYRR